MSGEKAWWAFQFIPKVVSRVASSSKPTLSNYVIMDLALGTGSLSCWNRLGPLVPVEGHLKATAYKDNLNNCVLPNLATSGNSLGKMSLMSTGFDCLALLCTLVFSVNLY